VTDLDNARTYLRLPNNAVHYLAVKCRSGTDLRKAATDLRASLPENSVHTAREFHDLTQAYWQERTGIAPMLFLSMTLAGVVGFMTVFLTFFLLTSQKLPVFAAMKALGASTAEIGVLLAVQLGVVFLAAAVVAGVVLLGALALFARTPISVVLPGWVVALDVGMMALASALACGPSLWKVAWAEPAEAFRM
jgi:ABC-type lipoprotein release transport system permease subunit